MEIRFRLNSKYSKDKQIIDFLEKQYNATEYIKQLLYRIVIDWESTSGNVVYGQVYSNSNKVIYNNSVHELEMVDELGNETEVTQIDNKGIETDTSVSIAEEFADLI